jgi:hypothetical protein
MTRNTWPWIVALLIGCVAGFALPRLGGRVDMYLAELVERSCLRAIIQVEQAKALFQAQQQVCPVHPSLDSTLLHKGPQEKM